MKHVNCTVWRWYRKITDKQKKEKHEKPKFICMSNVPSQFFQSPLLCVSEIILRGKLIFVNTEWIENTTRQTHKTQMRKIDHEWSEQSERERGRELINKERQKNSERKHNKIQWLTFWIVVCKWNCTKWCYEYVSWNFMIFRIKQEPHKLYMETKREKLYQFRLDNFYFLYTFSLWKSYKFIKIFQFSFKCWAISFLFRFEIFVVFFWFFFFLLVVCVRKYCS